MTGLILIKLCRQYVPLAACGALLLLNGCRRGNSEAPAPGSSQEKRSGIGRFFSPETAPGYAWDGQYSKATVNLAIDAAYDRALVVFHAINFKVNENESRRQGATAHIVAANASKTVAQVALESKSATDTEVKVKVGATGDRGGSERILDEIQKGPQPLPAKKKP